MKPPLPYTLLRRRNQKYVRIRIDGNGSVRVSAPALMSLKKIEEAVRSREEWIRKQSIRLKEQFESYDPGRGVLYMGETYPVESVYRKGSRNGVSLSEQAHRVLVRTNAGDKAAVEQLIAAWLRRRARRELLPRIRQVSKDTGIAFKSLYIRDQKSRWGSSSGRGNISINFRVIMAPPGVQHYLIVHELCHQRHFNHSPAFWAEVARFCPDYRESELWLKSHGVLLSLFRGKY